MIASTTAPLISIIWSLSHSLQHSSFVDLLNMRPVVFDAIELWTVGHIVHRENFELIHPFPSKIGPVNTEVVKEKRHIVFFDFLSDPF